MLYREMFDEVHAPQGLKEEVLNMTKQDTARVARKISAAFVIAAVLAVVLAGTALAAVAGVPQTLQEWFNQQWTESGGEGTMPKEEAEVIEGLIQPVGVTCVNKGISVTLDSVTAGKNNIWMILKVKGEPLTGEWEFGRMSFGGKLIEEAEAKSPSQGAVSQRSMKLLGTMEDGTEVYLFKYSGGPAGVNYLEGGELELRLQDFYLEASIDAAVPAGIHEDPIQVFPDVEARWVLPFTLESMKEMPALTAKSASLKGTDTVWKEGKEEPEKISKTFTVQNIQVTSIGYSYTIPKEAADFWFDSVSLRLKGDVTIQGTEAAHVTVQGAEDAALKRQGTWDLPVDLSKVEAICFGDVAVPLEQLKK